MYYLKIILTGTCIFHCEQLKITKSAKHLTGMTYYNDVMCPKRRFNIHSIRHNKSLTKGRNHLHWKSFGPDVHH